MADKKIYHLELSIALEADNLENAYQALISDQTHEQIKDMLVHSKDRIKEVLIEDTEEVSILN
ncbi:hypothetical protein [Tannockella kyphosi]|uniref:hypothetical protein n=1 Tax=Tannockella kyphosi TaxID=2899121 RepID=UPI002011BB27|nr:hypothetical protein [Tannockella kyphosi]